MMAMKVTDTRQMEVPLDSPEKILEKLEAFEELFKNRYTEAEKGYNRTCNRLDR